MPSWFPSFRRSRVTLPVSDENDHPLLPTSGTSNMDYDLGRSADGAQRSMFGLELNSRWKAPWLRQDYLVALLIGAIILLFMVAYLTGYQRLGPAQDFSGSNAHAQVDALYARQSSTLQQAIARYSLRNNRPPPPMYHKWFKFARDHSCLIDEYEQISRDFEPFYQLAKDDPGYFKRMVDKGTPHVQEDGRGLRTGKFARKRFSWKIFSWTDEQWSLYDWDWLRTFKRFASFIPDTKIIINGRDEPRVVFNYRVPEAHPTALNPQVSDETPFRHTPHPTASYFRDEMKCHVPMQPQGFTSLANDASAFLLYASSTDFTTDLYPVMSMTKISPCFSDILVPSEFYYSDSGWSPSYAYPNNISWHDKEEKLYWRGMTSGGWVYGDNYHAFPRFRLIDIGRKHPHIMDVRLSGFHDSLCGEKCDGEKIKAEYDIAQQSAPREEVYKFKYIVDVDGNSFSGRYLGLLRSGSLVFKSTVFSEYFSEWLRPFEHYIPILPDLSDLVEKIEWAKAHDQEAQAIQQAGQVFAQRVLTDAQNDCYFSAVLLEWAHLYGMATP